MSMDHHLDECDCEKLRRLLYVFIDNELDEDAAHSLRVHAELCPDCADAVDAQRHLQALLRRCCRQSAPADLRARVITRIRQTSVRIERW